MAETMPSIPGYEILGELGRGGMGRTYALFRRSLRAPVAFSTMNMGERSKSSRRRDKRKECAP